MKYTSSDDMQKPHDLLSVKVTLKSYAKCKERLGVHITGEVLGEAFSLKSFHTCAKDHTSISTPGSNQLTPFQSGWGGVVFEKDEGTRRFKLVAVHEMGVVFSRITHNIKKWIEEYTDGAEDVNLNVFYNCRCGVRNTESTEGIVTVINRIYRGQLPTAHEFPWMVYIYDKQKPKEFCSGSVITSKHVLTAFHCIILPPTVDKYGIVKSESIGLYIGHANYENVEYKFKYKVFGKRSVTKIQYYNTLRGLVENNVILSHWDVALLTLDVTLDFTYSISPICLPYDPELEHVDEEATIAGWGETKSGDEVDRFSSSMRYNDGVKIISRASCETFWELLSNRAGILTMTAQHLLEIISTCVTQMM